MQLTKTRRVRVVVVDDEDDLRTSLVSSLHRRSPGLGVEAAACATAALELLDAEPDLLVTDLRMPGLSGVALILAARAKHPQVRVLVMSAYIIDPQMLASPRTIAYLEKPFELPAFISAIDAALSRPRAPQVLGEVAQLFSIGQQSGGLLVCEGARRGEAWFAGGVLHHACMDVLEGEAALDEMMRWSHARFELTAEISTRWTVSSTYAALVARGSGCLTRSDP